MDKHYWKDAYQHLWEAASKKEEFVKQLIEAETGLDVHMVGLGAGSSGFITGSASDNQMEKGDADLYIPAIEAYLEVTGPNIPVNFEYGLWFRPDKFQNTAKKLEAGIGQHHFVIHLIDDKSSKNKVIRAVYLNLPFFKRLRDKEFKIVNPFIRGRQETYYEIPYNSNTILSFGEFIDLLKSINGVSS